MPKSRQEKSLPLSEYWRWSADDHTSNPEILIATTYEFDAAFFETELLSLFLGCKFDTAEKEKIFILEREQALCKTQVVVLVDWAKYNIAQSTQRYLQLPVRIPNGKQHAKVTVLVWEDRIRLLVTSANLTKAGYRTNREIFSAIDFFDEPSSAPQKLLIDALDFLERLCEFVEKDFRFTQQVFQSIRNKVANWSHMPRDFTPREKPWAKLIFGHPAHKKFSAQSSMDALLDFWGSRRAEVIKIVSPFFGVSNSAEDTVLKKFAQIPRSRNGKIYLAAPLADKSEEDEDNSAEKVAIMVPQNFGNSFISIWGNNAFVLAVPDIVPEEDGKKRELHTKAILLQNKEHTVLFLGSSNFTPHGMGLGVYNSECNILFEDFTSEKRGGLTLAERLDLLISWEQAVSASEVIWRSDLIIETQDSEVLQLLTPFFGLATYSQNTGVLCVLLNQHYKAPEEFNIFIHHETDENERIVIFTQEDYDPSKGFLERILDNQTRCRTITFLRVHWKEGEVFREAILPVQPEDPLDDILPPEALRHLSHDTIISHILRGKTFEQFILERGNGGSSISSPSSRRLAVDPLHTVNTSEYILYRITRLGKALTRMAAQVAQNYQMSAQALRYHLLYSPFGFAAFAKSLIKLPQRESPKIESVEKFKLEETSYTLFALAQIQMLFSHLCNYMVMKDRKRSRLIVTLFEEMQRVIQEVRDNLMADSNDVIPKLHSYIESCDMKSKKIFQKIENISKGKV